MRIFLGFAILAAAKTSIGEIQGLSMLIIAAVLFSGGAIVNAVNGIERQLKDARAPRTARDVPVVNDQVVL